MNVESPHEESFISPPPQDEDGDSMNDADRQVYWMDESLDTLDGMGAIVYTTDEVPWGEGRDLAWQSVRERVRPNYGLHWRAQKALAKLITVYENSMRDHPHRFRSGSRYEKKLSECKLFEQGIDVIFLEMQLRIEFCATPLSNLVRGTWEEAAFNEAYNEWMEDLDDSGEVEGGEEENDGPAEEIVVSAGIVEEVEEYLIEEVEEIIFDHLVVEEEEGEEEEELAGEVPAMEAEEMVEEGSTVEAEEEGEGGDDAPEAVMARENRIDFDQLFSGLTEIVEEEEEDWKDARAVVPRVHWSDGDFAHRRYRPHSQSGHTVSSEVYFKCSVGRRRLERHSKHYGCVLDELTGLTKVHFVPLQDQGRPNSDTESDKDAEAGIEAGGEESVEEQDFNFDHEVVEQEDEIPPKRKRKHKRSKGKRELASLGCGLGSYWLSSTSDLTRQGQVRRSRRKTSAPARYSP